MLQSGPVFICGRFHETSEAVDTQVYIRTGAIGDVAKVANGSLEEFLHVWREAGAFGWVFEGFVEIRAVPWVTLGHLELFQYLENNLRLR